MSAKPAVDIRFCATNCYVANLTGALATLASKLQARTDLDTAAEWTALFGAPNGFLPESAMFYFNVGASAVTIAGPTQADETTLPQSTPSPWFTITDLTKIRVNGTVSVVIIW